MASPLGVPNSQVSLYTCVFHVHVYKIISASSAFLLRRWWWWWGSSFVLGSLLLIPPWCLCGILCFIHQFSFCRRCQPCTEEFIDNAPERLDCTLYRKFWVTWSYGVIRVGEGWRIPDDEFMIYPDPEPFTVRNVAIRRRDETVLDGGRWFFTVFDRWTWADNEDGKHGG